MRNLLLFIGTALLISCSNPQKEMEEIMDSNHEQTWTQIPAKDLNKNAIKLIGDDWMLITAGTQEKYNTMTASWGGMGYLWNKPMAFIFIRPQRYTYEFVEKQDYFTLSFFDSTYRSALQICGSTSGRDGNKVEKAGLHPRFTTMGTPAFEEARIILECKKEYASFLEKDAFINQENLNNHYPDLDLHKMYIGEIVNVWIKK